MRKEQVLVSYLLKLLAGLKEDVLSLGLETYIQDSKLKDGKE
jgi:hypothetical protein